MAKSSNRQQVRIISGRYRRRLIQFPDEKQLRPTSDRVRETLFNWLQNDIGGRRCLDLFAGSGVLGLEAASRGASEVVLVEQSIVASRAINEAIRQLDATAAHCLNQNALDYLKSNETPFDLVFLDPPFATNLADESVLALETGGHLSDNALVYLEQPKKSDPLALPKHWNPLKSATAGDVCYTLYSVNQSI